MLVFHLDDSRPIRTGVEAVLTDAGFGYFGSDQWSEISAKMFALKGATAVLLADLHMPGIKGEDFCRTTIKHCPGVIVILYSGGHEIEAAAKRLGCRFVEKDAGPYKLIETVRAASLGLDKP